jgi:hypothetical protein
VILININKSDKRKINELQSDAKAQFISHQLQIFICNGNIFVDGQLLELAYEDLKFIEQVRKDTW